MTDGLHIARGLTLPLDAITRTFGIFANRGAGKTSTGAVLAEEIVRVGGHVIIFDPVGAWWGITHAGERAGLPGIVLGGEHGDVPLEETAGKLVAELAIGRHWPMIVVDMQLLRKGAQLRFMADSLEELYFRNRLPLHVIFEEADRPLPQSPRGMDPTMGRVLGAAEDIVKLGRGRGMGATLISQRFATVNKNVTEQIETLILLRLIGPNDRKAAKTWIESNGDATVTENVLGSLAKLQVGEAQVYSPGWLQLLEKVRIRPRRTFDSSKTPEVGTDLAEPTARAPVDLDELRTRMADTIERAKADNPTELRKRIRDLERQLAERPDVAPEPVEVEVIREVPALTERDLAPLYELDEELAKIRNAIADTRDKVAAATNAGARVVDERKTARSAESRRSTGHAPPVASARLAPPPRSRPRAAPAPGPAAQTNGNGDIRLARAERSILSVLAQFPDGRNMRQLAMLAGYSAKGGGFRNALSALRTNELITRSDPIRITDEGLAAIDGQYEPLPDGPALLEHWLAQVPRAEREILRALADVYPEPLTKEEVAERTGYSPDGGGFRNALSKLRTLQLIDGRGELRLDDTIGEEAAR